ncbi:Glutathione-regulated potassium-efflux system ancillary protein kefF [Pandoraea pulmonicola]|uniref:Glutathione-regulated potassium-efflux system ancillary protein kefF n=2 Tax=Pandoraea pulmonicola TaxID=93221 RepID=A0AAJ4ZEK4_PANPU|nr:Glutathione-regulated potassium-efflux system ancillary protein kefF [Pandoraea pulmonicola]
MLPGMTFPASPPNSGDAPADADGAPGRSVYVIVAHPRWRDSRVNRRLLAAARSIAGVDVNDLYSTYPDFSIDVAAEQRRVARADLIALVHPIYWYSMPPLQKLWLDEVLSWGWAYGHGGHALAHKDLWLVASTGGPHASYRAEGYNQHDFADFLPAYEQTARLCGMRFLPPHVFYGARRSDDAALDAHVSDFAGRLATYPQWPELISMAEAPECGDIPVADRPRCQTGVADAVAPSASDDEIVGTGKGV